MAQSAPAPMCTLLCFVRSSSWQHKGSVLHLWNAVFSIYSLSINAILFTWVLERHADGFCPRKNAIFKNRYGCAIKQWKVLCVLAFSVCHISAKDSERQEMVLYWLCITFIMHRQRINNVYNLFRLECVLLALLLRMCHCNILLPWIFNTYQVLCVTLNCSQSAAFGVCIQMEMCVSCCKLHSSIIKSAETLCAHRAKKAPRKTN